MDGAPITRSTADIVDEVLTLLDLRIEEHGEEAITLAAEVQVMQAFIEDLQARQAERVARLARGGDQDNSRQDAS